MRKFLLTFIVTLLTISSGFVGRAQEPSPIPTPPQQYYQQPTVRNNTLFCQGIELWYDDALNNQEYFPLPPEPPTECNEVGFFIAEFHDVPNPDGTAIRRAYKRWDQLISRVSATSRATITVFTANSLENFPTDADTGETLVYSVGWAGLYFKDEQGNLQGQNAAYFNESLAISECRQIDEHSYCLAESRYESPDQREINSGWVRMDWLSPVPRDFNNFEGSGFDQGHHPFFEEEIHPIFFTPPLGEPMRADALENKPPQSTPVG